MKILNKSSIALPQEQKSKDVMSPLSFTSFIDFLAGNSYHDLSAHVALSYYRKVSPIFDAVDRISDEVSSIEPVLYDKKKEEYITDHPVLELLNNPNAFASGDLFIKELCTYYLVTGNAYLRGTGGINKPPKELFNEHPTTVTITPNNRDGFPQQYEVTTTVEGKIYKRVEQGVDYRFVDPMELGEIFHIKTVNPTASTSYLYGMSRLTPIYYEIEQYLHASVHNLALLKNGATPSGIMSTEKNLTDDQYQRLLAEMGRFFQGAENAGRPMIAEGGLKYSSMSMNNRDMDFLKLKVDVRDMLYNNFRIPLPFVSREQMTLANMEAAKYIFYDNVILPTFKRLMTDLSLALLPRYGLDPKDYELSYQEESIPTLVQRHFEETKDLNDMGVLTKNEIRLRLGYEELEGHDILYQPMNLIPTGAELEEPQDLQKQYKYFKNYLMKQKDSEGKALYTEEEIDQLAEQEGLLNVN